MSAKEKPTISAGGKEYEPWVGSATILKLFPMSSSKLNRLVNGNPPMPHRRIGRTYIFRVSDVDRFIDKYGEALVDTRKQYGD